MKQITGVYTAPAQHCRRRLPGSLDVFLSDARPAAEPLLTARLCRAVHLPGGQRKRGVGEHPHRGFETVTIVYAGEVEHRDSTGRGGVIGQATCSG